MIIKDPYFIAYPTETGKTEMRLHPGDDITYEHYAILICDLVRHTARCFDVPETKVWQMIDRERRHPTSDIERIS
jgi:hypothetical protein